MEISDDKKKVGKKNGLLVMHKAGQDEKLDYYRSNVHDDVYSEI